MSAVFHYLGPSFAVLLFARLPVLGVAWLRIGAAAVIFALWRRPWQALVGLDTSGRRLLLQWGAVLAVMNVCFYSAIGRLPLGTVSAIEFLPVVFLAALGARSRRNVLALGLAVGGVGLLTDVRLTGAAMLVAAVVVTPIGGSAAVRAFTSPIVLAAGIGVGISSSVVPYVTDQLAMARMPRATYATLVALLPAVATIIGIVVLAQVPRPSEVLGVACVMAAVAAHRPALSARR